MNGFNDDEDLEPQLSGNALDALKEFYAERDAREKQFEDLKATAEKKHKALISMDTFAENWQESQFWYSQDTANTIAKQLLKGCTRDTKIAVVSAPSAFVQLKNIIAASDMTDDQTPQIYLLEIDDRFSVFPEFVLYDFNHPFRLPSSMKGTIDHFVIDPPFLSEDCQAKAAMTVRWLSKSWGIGEDKIKDDAKSGKVIVCTGERMAPLINKLYRPQGVTATTFLPLHSKGLSNEFYSYANFECEEWTLKK